MGAVEETRRMVKDFLAPELREIKARLEALEATTKPRFDASEEANKARFDSLDKVIAAQHAAVMSALTNLTNSSALAERLS